MVAWYQWGTVGGMMVAVRYSWGHDGSSEVQLTLYGSWQSASHQRRRCFIAYTGALVIHDIKASIICGVGC